jgi:anti-sigma-K factor RskA
MTHPNLNIADAERLVQRFVDQELSAEERVRFVARLGRDEALRQRTIELEQLVLDVSRLPRPAVPDAFVARVMERTGPARRAWWRQWVNPLVAPRTLQWNLAGAAAAACLAIMAGAIISGRLTTGPGPSAPGAAGTPATAAATTPSTALVRLVVLQPGARTVQVAGDFNGWNPASTSLEQTSDGAWTVTIPLKPGRYKYMFVVDGDRWIVDPLAAEQTDDGFGSRNAVLDVRPVADEGTTRAAS